jgi:tRNA-dihydrouridine synthase 1
VAEGLLEYERTDGKSVEGDVPPAAAAAEDDDPESSARAIRECKRPWWVVQPIIRPLPKEAMAKGAVQLSKKDKKRVAAEMEGTEEKGAKRNKEAAATSDKPAAETGAATASLEKTTSYPSSELVSG